jgi:Fur family ferric uptake transcriptional regulator
VARAKARTSKAKPDDILELQALLRSVGLRSTVPRIAVLRFLRSSGSPASHPEVYDAVGGEGFDRATLYRNLMDLAEAGLLRRTDLGDHTWRFELESQSGGHAGEHAHFICTDCGGVSCLPGGSVKIVAKNGAPRAVTAKAVEVHLKGRCDNCG